MLGSRFLRRTFLTILALLSPLLAQAPPDGKLIVGGQTIKLTQVYAYAAADFFDKTKDDTVVLLTDRPVAAAQLRDAFGLSHMAEEGKLSFVQATINPAGQVINFMVGNRAFKMTPSSGSTEQRFEGKREGATISGKVFTRGPQDFFGGPKYEYSATFKVTVLPKK